jgi:hypothetical protein
MQDARFSAVLKAAKFVAHSEDDKTIRRVQFALCAPFSLEIAEWLGAVATNQRDLMQNGDLDSCEIAIDAYHAKASFQGLAGNTSADVDGIKAVATVKAGKEEGEQSEDVTFTFEAFPEAKLLTFIAASLKEWIECDFKRTQLDLAGTGNQGGK